MKNRGIQKILSLSIVLFLCTVVMKAQEREMTSTNSVVRNMTDQDLQWGPCPDFLPNGCEIAVLHGDPAKKNVDIFFKVPAGSDIANHAHTSAERMILISGEMEVQYEGEEARTLKKGSYAYGPAEKPHTARCGNAGPCVLFIAFEEPMDAYAVKK